MIYLCLQCNRFHATSEQAKRCNHKAIEVAIQDNKEKDKTKK